MTRKSKKGIVGKFPTSSERKEPVGPGIDFVDEHLTNGHEIENAVKKRMHD